MTADNESAPGTDTMLSIEHDDIEKKLHGSEERYRSLVSAIAQIVWTTDSNGCICGEMSTWCAYTGQDAAHMDREKVLEAIHPDDRKSVYRAWKQAVETKQLYEAEYRLRRYDGIYRYFLARGVPVFEENGSIREWVGVCSDINERKLLEEHLLESEHHFRVMFEQAAMGIAHVSIDGHWQQVNQKLCAILGFTREELLERTFQDITYPDDLETDLEYIQRLLHNDIQTYTIEKRYFRKDGSLIWTNLTVSLVRDNQARPLYFISIVEDISERKRAEVEAAEQTQQLKAVFTSMTDAVLVYDCDGNTIFASPAAQEVFPLGIQAEQPSQPGQKRPFLYVLWDEQGRPLLSERAPIQRVLRGEVLKGANAVDVVFHIANGQPRYLSISGSPMHNMEGEIIGGVLIARDITERHQLERRTQEALEGMLAMAEALIRLPDSDGTIDTVGQPLAELTCSMLGCQRVGIFVVEQATELLRPIAVVGLAPEQERAWWEEQRQQESTLRESPTPELVERLRAGEVIVLDMRNPPFNDLPNPYAIKVMLTAPMNIGTRLVGLLTLDYGDVGHSYSEDEIALASAVAKLSALVIERQRLLSEQAEAQGREVALQESNRRMEEFLGVASHELRTPLTTIKANIQLAMRRLKSLSDRASVATEEINGKVSATQDMLTRAERQVGVLNRLVGDMIDISRIQADKLQVHLRQEPANLVAIVQEVVQEQRKAVPGRSILVEMPATETIPILADPDRIGQVLTNYISNALKYSEATKSVAVRLACDGQIARVSVRDEGPGLSSEEQQRIWECFYQAPDIKVLSGSGVGLGLGLYISQTVIERHQGQVGVQSTQGKGSTFWFTLPIAQLADTTENEA